MEIKIEKQANNKRVIHLKLEIEEAKELDSSFGSCLYAMTDVFDTSLPDDIEDLRNLLVVVIEVDKLDEVFNNVGVYLDLLELQRWIINAHIFDAEHREAKYISFEGTIGGWLFLKRGMYCGYQAAVDKEMAKKRGYSDKELQNMETLAKRINKDLKKKFGKFVDEYKL
jgi:hypothetical protein